MKVIRAERFGNSSTQFFCISCVETLVFGCTTVIKQAPSDTFSEIMKQIVSTYNEP